MEAATMEEARGVESRLTMATEAAAIVAVVKSPAARVEENMQIARTVEVMVAVARAAVAVAAARGNGRKRSWRHRWSRRGWRRRGRQW